MNARVVRLPVTCDDVAWKRVLADFAQYRAAARQAFSLFAMAQMAGARIEQRSDGVRVVPINDRAKTILAETMDMSVKQRTRPSVSKSLKTLADTLAKIDANKLTDGLRKKLEDALENIKDAAGLHNWAEDISKQGAAPAYEVRDWVLGDLLKDWSPHVFDTLRRELVTLWQANDPEHPKATRGWLMLNGARRLAKFNRLGLEFPVITNAHTFGPRSITLKWHGEPIEFSLGSVEPQNWHHWLKIRTKSVEIGSLALIEKDGKLAIIIPMDRQPVLNDLDKEKTATIKLSENGVAVIADDAEICDVSGVVVALKRIKRQKEKLEIARGRAGSPGRPWGHRKAWKSEQERIHGLALARTALVKNWNHAWSRKCIDVALRHRCGKISVVGSPSMIQAESWPWAQFREMLIYKCVDAGIAYIELTPEVKPEKPDAKVSL